MAMQRIQVRIGPGDAETLAEMAESEGVTVSEIVRQWVARECRNVRAAEGNSRAALALEGLLGKSLVESIDRGETTLANAVFEHLGKPRSSNTGATRPNLAAEGSPAPLPVPPLTPKKVNFRKHKRR